MSVAPSHSAHYYPLLQEHASPELIRKTCLQLPTLSWDTGASRSRPTSPAFTNFNSSDIARECLSVLAEIAGIAAAQFPHLFSLGQAVVWQHSRDARAQTAFKAI
jgi:hypothetical protein